MQQRHTNTPDFQKSSARTNAVRACAFPALRVSAPSAGLCGRAAWTPRGSGDQRGCLPPEGRGRQRCARPCCGLAARPLRGALCWAPGDGTALRWTLVSIPPTSAAGHSPRAGAGTSSPRLCLRLGGGPCPGLADAWAPNLVPRAAFGQRQRAVPAPASRQAPCLSRILPPPPSCFFQGPSSADLPHASSVPCLGHRLMPAGQHPAP